MLDKYPLIAFVPVTDAAKARAFYEGCLGLRPVSDDSFATVLDANGIMLRLVKLKALTPAPFTILGWEVPDIEEAVTRLAGRGVSFMRPGLPGLDERGIWSAPSGSRVAWFQDPDGNVLSVSQHPPAGPAAP